MPINEHTLIISLLIAFGSGHAAGRSKIGFWLVLLVAMPMYSQLFEGLSLKVAIAGFVLGIAYARWHNIRDTFEGLFDGIRSLFDAVGRMFSFLTYKRKTRPEQPYFHTHQETNHNQKQAWEVEQRRREQESKAQRQQNQQDSTNQTKHTKHEEQQQKQQSRQSEQRERRKQQNNHSGKKKYRQQQEQLPPETEEVDTRSPHEILGLDSVFTEQELKQAYKRASAQCHPDKWTSRPRAIRTAMEEEQKRINKAYKTLRS